MIRAVKINITKTLGVTFTFSMNDLTENVRNALYRFEYFDFFSENSWVDDYQTRYMTLNMEDMLWFIKEFGITYLLLEDRVLNVNPE